MQMCAFTSNEIFKATLHDYCKPSSILVIPEMKNCPPEDSPDASGNKPPNQYLPKIRARSCVQHFLREIRKIVEPLQGKKTNPRQWQGSLAFHFGGG